MKIIVDQHAVGSVNDILDKGHDAVFGSPRPEADRYSDIALLARDENHGLLGFASVRIVDQDTVVIPYAGVFPGARKHSANVAIDVAIAIRDHLFRDYKSIMSLIARDNVRALSMAFRIGYRILGVRLNPGGHLLVELEVKREV